MAAASATGEANPTARRCCLNSRWRRKRGKRFWWQPAASPRSTWWTEAICRRTCWRTARRLRSRRSESEASPRSGRSTTTSRRYPGRSTPNSKDDRPRRSTVSLRHGPTRSTSTKGNNVHPRRSAGFRAPARSKEAAARSRSGHASARSRTARLGRLLPRRGTLLLLARPRRPSLPRVKISKTTTTGTARRPERRATLSRRRSRMFRPAVRSRRMSQPAASLAPTLTNQARIHTHFSFWMKSQRKQLYSLALAQYLFFRCTRAHLPGPEFSCKKAAIL